MWAGVWTGGAWAQDYIDLGPPVVKLQPVAAPGLEAGAGQTTDKSLQTVFAAGQYGDAVVIAKTRLAQAQSGEKGIDIATAWSDLGACQYRAGDFTAAARSYGRAVQLLDQSENHRDPRFIRPLYGLGAAQYSQGDYAGAAQNMQRAIFLTRVHDGLSSLSQLQHYSALIESYLAQGHYDAAEKRQKARLAIIARAHGLDSPEFAGALQQVARFFHRLNRYFDEREYLLRQLRLVAKQQGSDSPLLAPILLKLGATYRLDHDPKYVALTDLQRALTILKEQPGLSGGAQQADALVALGDLYLTFDRSARAYHYYEAAYDLLTKAGDTGKIQVLFSKPVAVFVPRPKALAGVGDTPAAGLPVGYVEMQFNLSSRGRPQDIETLKVQPAYALRMQARAQRAMRLSRFRLPINAQGPVKQKGVKYKLLFNYVESNG